MSRYNSEHGKEKVVCDICNKTMTRSSLWRHKQSVHISPKGKRERDYSKGKIYMVLDSVEGSEVYIGSTTGSLTKRLMEHKSDNKNTTAAKQICDKYDNVRIILIEEYPCKNNHELRQREQYYIDLIPCVNIINAYINVKEYQKAYNKMYREKKNNQKVT